MSGDPAQKADQPSAGTTSDVRQRGPRDLMSEHGGPIRWKRMAACTDAAFAVKRADLAEVRHQRPF
jgi:hypothetical protein